MIDQRSVERAAERFRLPEGSFERLVLRRDRKRRTRRIGTIVLALAVAAAAIGGVVEAIRRAEPSARPANLPSTPEAWSRLRPDLPLEGAYGITAGGPGLIAFQAGQGERLAGVWTSSDGRTWARVPGSQLGPGLISDVTSGGRGLVAVGSNVWTSQDGRTWSRLPDDPVLGDTFISAVSPGGPGLVAVGSFPGAWFSSDGETWERASVPPVPPDVYLGDDFYLGKDVEDPKVYLSDVAESADRLVAVGSALLEDNTYRVVVWTSGDGRSWADVSEQDAFPPGSQIIDLTGGPDGLVAVGQVGSTAAIWNSADGRRWRLEFPGPGVRLHSVAAGDGGYVAVGANNGCTGQTCSSHEALVMTSVDGKTWIKVPSDSVFRVDEPKDPENNGGAEMNTVVSWGSSYVSLGTYDNEPVVWIAGQS